MPPSGDGGVQQRTSSTSGHHLALPTVIGIILAVGVGLAVTAAVAIQCYKMVRRKGRRRPLLPRQKAWDKRMKKALWSPTKLSTEIATKFGKGKPSSGGSSRSSSRKQSPTDDFPNGREERRFEISSSEEDRSSGICSAEGMMSPFLGTLYFSTRYDPNERTLAVCVQRVCDLPVMDPISGNADPFVKLELLPDKMQAAKTRTIKNTRNPVYDETFTFYDIEPKLLESLRLHFVIFSFDRFSQDESIGEVHYPVSSSLHPDSPVGQTVCRDITPRIPAASRYQLEERGELLVSLCYQPAASRLTVTVLKGRNFPKMDITGLADPYVKVYLMYDNQRMSKKKTQVKKSTINPVFNESFVFNIPGSEIDRLSVDLSAFDWDKLSSNDRIGGIKVGGGSAGVALAHWREVIDNPGKQIARWHKLQDV